MTLRDKNGVVSADETTFKCLEVWKLYFLLVCYVSSQYLS